MMTLSTVTNLNTIHKQTITITPQVKQALYLLRLPLLDLQKEIQNAVANNPLLEQDELQFLEIEKKISNSLQKSPEEIFKRVASIPHSGESHLKEYCSSTVRNKPLMTQSTSLHSHLYWQSELTQFSDNEHKIAKIIIDYIDEDGYLTIDIDKLTLLINNISHPTSTIAVEQVLYKIQQFDPTGVAARDLSECLLIQLNELSNLSKTVQFAKEIVTQHLHLVALHDYRTLAKTMHCKDSMLVEPLNLIRSLTPRPGECFQPIEYSYVLPDLIVYKETTWQVKLNEELLPHLTINQCCSQLSTHHDRAFLQTYLHQANSFLNGLENRYTTLLKVAQFIIQHQWQFFEKDNHPINPLKLADVATKLQLHESTVSRAIAHKYLICEHGLFMLKHFFSGSYQSANGTAVSAIDIKERIKQLIHQENKLKPLSDNQLAILLQNEGFSLSRRTIAKYRETLFIAPSHQRKQLISNQ